MWDLVPRDEQETVINIDYYEKTITVYTSRKSVAERLKRKVGDPDYADKIENRIVGVTYKMPLHDKRVKQFLSIGNIIGGFRNNNEIEETEDERETGEID